MGDTFAHVVVGLLRSVAAAVACQVGNELHNSYSGMSTGMRCRFYCIIQL